MTVDKHTLDKAKKWARTVSPGPGDPCYSAAEVVRDLPVAIVDGDKVRELIERTPIDPGATALLPLIKGLQALLPAPKPQVEIALGAWAMHPEHGKVLIVSTRADSDGWVRVCMEDDAYPVGARVRHVKSADLSPLPDTQDDSEEQSEYAPGGVLPERTSTEKDQMHRTLEKLNQQYTEPQPGEAWEVEVAGKRRESIKLSHANMCWLTVDDNGTSVTYMDTEISVLRRLVPAQEPRVLTTVEDYVSAPVGTIIGGGGNHVWEKVGKSRWVSPFFADKSNLDMAGVTITVLWEPEA